MDGMNLIVAGNIRRLREARRLSMDELARLSGVSKSMLAQIERGEGNPTLSTLWKLSNGMKVPFDELIARPPVPYELVRLGEIQPLPGDDSRVRNYPLFPDGEGRRFAVYYLELDEGGLLCSEPHLRGTVEFITIFSGTLAVRAGEREFTLAPGESLRFGGDVSHAYRNAGAGMVTLHMILYNP